MQREPPLVRGLGHGQPCVAVQGRGAEHRMVGIRDPRAVLHDQRRGSLAEVGVQQFVEFMLGEVPCQHRPAAGLRVGASGDQACKRRMGASQRGWTTVAGPSAGDWATGMSVDVGVMRGA